MLLLFALFARRVLMAHELLTAAVWTEEQRAFRFTTRLHQSKLDPETLRVLEEKAEILSGLSTNPFRALPPEELAENGYTRTLSADTVEYYAPDASVLLSDPFVDDHCFRVVEGTGDTQGMIGLEFEPLLRDDRTEISGVLWLDRSDAHLQFIQYRYENLRSGFRSDKVGGRIDFRRLPGGAWIVDDWYIRMPVFELVTVTERSGPAVPGNRSHTRQEHRLGFLTEQGGQVLMVADESGHIADAQSASRTGRGVVTGEVFDSTANAPLQGATVSLLGTNLRTTTDEAGRYTLEDLPVGNFHVTFSHPKMRLLEPGAVYRPVRVRQGTVARVDLAVPSTNVLLQSLCPDESGQSGTAVVGTITEAGTGRPSVGAVVRLSSHILGILAASAETLTEDDRSDSGLGVPASAAHYEAVADENGGFRICGVPAGLRAYMTAFANESGPHAGADVVYFTVPDGIYMTTLEIPSAASRPEGS